MADHGEKEKGEEIYAYQDPASEWPKGFRELCFLLVVRGAGQISQRHCFKP